MPEVGAALAFLLFFLLTFFLEDLLKIRFPCLLEIVQFHKIIFFNVNCTEQHFAPKVTCFLQQECVLCMPVAENLS